KNYFKSFEKKPIASASIGQVHIAYLENDTKVAVKLRKANIKEQILSDIKIIESFNYIFKPLFSYYTKNSVESVINEFSKMIKEEISFEIELQNLISFSEFYKDSGIRFPKPYSEYSTDNALVMSYEEGFRFDDKENLQKYEINFNALMSKLVYFYTDQMLINGYFHADPHPGNLLVNKQGELILLDFGMVKKISNNTRVSIIQLLKAANERDYELYINASKKLGTIAYEAPVDELSEFTDKMFEIFSNENLSSQSMQKLAFNVLDSTKNLPFKLPSDAIYILRVSGIIEGLGTNYIENFNGIKDILPLLQSSLPKALNLDENIFENLINNIKEVPFIIEDLKTSIKKIANSELVVQASKDQLEWISKEIKTYTGSIIKSLVFIILGFFILIYDNELKNLALLLVTIGSIKLFFK
ncbi:MAG: ABC1 family protein, partial [uncultured Campylobacterales bacterium]